MTNACRFTDLGQNKKVCVHCGLVVRSGHLAENIHSRCAATQGKPGLGDYIATALQFVGITPERYVAAKAAVRLKKKCRCKERQELLNSLGRKVRIS